MYRGVPAAWLSIVNESGFIAAGAALDDGAALTEICAMPTSTSLSPAVVRIMLSGLTSGCTSSGASFAKDTPGLLVRSACPQDLERHATTELLVVRPEDLPHPPFAERRLDDIAIDAISDIHGRALGV